MKKSIISILFFVLCLSVCRGNSVRNGNFAQDPVSGKVNGWSTIEQKIQKGRKCCVFRNNSAIISLEPGEKMIALLQRGFLLTPGVRYRLSFELKGTKGTQLGSYFEWELKNGRYNNSNILRSQATEEWESCSFTFLMPADQLKSTPYLAFTLSKPGKAEIRRVSLEEVKTNAQNLIRNPEFGSASAERAADWDIITNKIKPNRKACQFTGGKACLSLESGEKMIALLQHNVKLTSGVRYRLTFDAKGAKGTSLAAYFEWTRKNGRLTGTGASQHQLTEEWKTCSFSFLMPADQLKSNPYLAFTLTKPGKAEIRRVSLVEVKTNAQNLIRNPEFDNASAGKDWAVITNQVKKGRNACQFDGEKVRLSLEPAEKMVALVQHNFKFVPGAQYRLSFEAKGAKGTEFSVYFEWVLKNGKYGNSKSGKFSGTGEWQKLTYDFQALPKGTEYKQLPYLAFLLNKAGSVELRNLVLVPNKSSAYIADPGFENPRNTQWDLKKKSRILPTGGHFAPGVLCLDGKGASASLSILLPPGKNYNFSYYVVGRNNTETTNGFSEFVCNMTLNGQGLEGSQNKQDCFASIWQSRSRAIRTPKDRESVLQITLVSLSAGQVLFDDFNIEEVKMDEKKGLEIVLHTPAYRNMIFSSDPVSEVSGMIETKKNLKSLNVIFNGKKIAVQPGGKFTFPAKDLKVGKYSLAAEAIDANGKKVTEKIIIEKLPPAKYEVVYNSKKQLLVNGKPLFLCGFYLAQVPRSPVANYYVKRVGACVELGILGGDLKERMDLCHQAGIKVVLDIGAVNLYSRNASPGKFKPLWEKRLALLNTVKQHPALIAYYPFDEPVWNGIPLECMKYIYESLKKMDPYHPVSSIEAPRGTPDDWRAHAQYCDDFGVDIYPVPVEATHSELPERGLRSVGIYTRLSEQTVNGRKPVQMYLQAFDWGNLVMTPRSFYRSPTQEEFRFMNFDAILHGCTMVKFYRDRNTDVKAEHYMYRELNLFNRFAPAMICGTPVPVKTDSSKDVMIRRWQYKGNSYLIFQNRSDNAGFAVLPQGSWYQIEPEKSIQVKGKIALPKLSCRLFCTAKELPLENTIKADAEMEKQIPEFFKRICLRTRLLSREVKWIWSEDGKERSVCCAVRQLSITKPVKKAILRMTADNEFTCALDGEKVLEGYNWEYLSVCDVTQKLTQGKHIIAVQAVDMGGSYAIAGDLVIEYTDGTRELIVTDSQWRATSKPVSGPWQKIGLPQAAPAKEFAPLGKGPWKI